MRSRADLLAGMRPWLAALAVATVASLSPAAGVLAADEPAQPAAADTPKTAEQAPPMVTCPALEFEYYNFYPERVPICSNNIGGDAFFAPRYISLVALGTAKKLFQVDDCWGCYQLKIKELLQGNIPYGYAIKDLESSGDNEPEKEIVFWGNIIDDTHQNTPRIFALTFDRLFIHGIGEQNSLVFVYNVSADDREAELAVAAARLDYYALSARRIVVGEEKEYEIAVKDIISGEPLPESETHVSDNFPSRGNDGTATGSMVYFFETGNSRIAQMDISPTVVKEALARGNSCSLYKKMDSDELVREVVYRGSVADAVRLMGAANPIATMLFARSLLFQREAAIPEVLKTIRADLFTAESANPATFRRLRNLIWWLKCAGEGGVDGECGKLLDEYLTRLETKPPKAPAPPKRKPLGEYEKAPLEQDQVDVNHALAWLMAGMNPLDASRKFGARLLKLRGSAGRHWRKEIQLAIDTVQVDNQLELSKVLASTTLPPPACSKIEDSYHWIRGTEFEWRRSIKCVESGGRESDDKRFAYIFHPGWKGSGYSNGFQVLDSQTRKTENKEFDHPSGKIQFAGLVPGGRWLHWYGYNMISIMDRKSLHVVSTRTVGGMIEKAVFSGDGMRYALLEYEVSFCDFCPGSSLFHPCYYLRRKWQEIERGIPPSITHYHNSSTGVIRVHDTQTGKTLFAIPVVGQCDEVALSTKGDRLAVRSGNELKIWTLPDAGGEKPAAKDAGK